MRTALTVRVMSSLLLEMNHLERTQNKSSVLTDEACQLKIKEPKQMIHIDQFKLCKITSTASAGFKGMDPTKQILLERSKVGVSFGSEMSLVTFWIVGEFGGCEV
jgi:hypothetical protein